MMPALIQIIYFIGAILLILGLKKMSTPNNAKTGLIWTAVGLIITILITFLHPQVNNYILMTLALLVGGVLAFLKAKKVNSAAMPQMSALFSGLGGAAVAAIVAVEFIKPEPLADMADVAKYIALLGALLGSISFSGSLIAYAKHKGLIKNTIDLPLHHWLNALILVVTVTFGVAIVMNGDNFNINYLVIFSLLALILGLFILLPIDNDDLPITSALLTACSGFAIGCIGYALANPLVMIAGLLAGATALTLSKQISESKKRPLPSMIFGDEESTKTDKQKKQSNKNINEINANDAASVMALAKNVIIVPGYGMAISQAQHKLADLSKQLINNGVEVKFALHPVAGRMPGHMNVLLTEAGIPFDLIHDIDAVNNGFESTDVVLVIGANDVTNPSARTDQSGPLFGMPILNVDKAKNVIVIKRGDGMGYSEIDNPLFYQSNTGLIYGNAESVLDNLVSHLKSV